MDRLRAGSLGLGLAGEPTGVELVHADQPVLTPPAQPGRPGLLSGLGFQTTASVGARRWRAGPAQWPLDPANDDPPPGDGWRHAVAVTDLEVAPGGRRARARLATDDPEGRVLVADLAVDGEGASVTVTVAGGAGGVEAVGCAFAAAPGERWLGFGERSDRVVRDRGVVEHYVGEGPWQEWEYPFLGPTVPVWGIRQRRDATYFPVPWVLSTAGFGVAVEDDDVSYVRLRPGDRAVWSLEVEASRLTLRLVPGPTALDALRRYTARVGRQGEPQPWWFGPWYQTGHDNHVPLEEERRQLARLRAAGAPVSAAETHCRYLPLGEHRGHEASERARVEHLHGAGLAVLAYLNPLVSVDHPEAFAPAAASGALLRRSDDRPYTFEAYAGGREPPVTLETQYDFTHPAAGHHWATVAGQVTDAGYDGWMEDFGEYTPLDAVLADGPTGPGQPAGTAGHNRYPTDYHAAASRVTDDLEARSGRRLARFVRSGWTGTAAVAPIVWGGDPTTSWGFDGLASAVVEGLSAGASGVAMWGSDIGGFVSSVDRLTPELLCRWIELGACTPVMRTKAGGIQGPDVVRPQVWDDEIVGVWARWAAWHTQLNPYLAAAHAAYRETGRPIMAALALTDPAHAEGLDVEDAYLLGPDLLVAPILADGARSRPVVLPGGAWVDLWRAGRYVPGTRELTLVGGARPFTGPGPVVVPAPLEEIPVLVRAGSVLPLLSPEVDSLSPYPAPGVVSARDRDHERRLVCFPHGTWEGALGPGEAAASRVIARTWHLELPTARARRYRVQADLGLVGSGPPPAVTADGAARVAYDPETGVLDAEVGGPSLTVRWG